MEFGVILALIILYTNLGFFPSLAALVSTVLVIIIDTPLANMQKDFQTKVMESKDSRIKATAEILKSIRHSWESNFKKKLIDLREKNETGSRNTCIHARPLLSYFGHHLR
ncbi:hypothetical protein L1987_79470 [Smallanthus sonchifolius]|uniref:Uncharacterized protein n=1 Tax=Smallanthus sonchifolius TaxID=185202 RepID=A0ACB8ZFI4_9ASTR|nr:hypothetical protein L1987_79470 [Smallanthus sonchifolius]